MKGLRAYYLLLIISSSISSSAFAKTPQDYSELKASVMLGFSNERISTIKAFINKNKAAFQKKNTSLYNKSVKLLEDITKLSSQKEPNSLRIESLMKEVFDAVRGLDGSFATLKALFQPSVTENENEFSGCEKNYQWINNKKMGEGIGGSVYVACDIQSRGKDCSYVTKVSPSTFTSHAETLILNKLDNQGITPKLKETYECKRKDATSGKVTNITITTMDKFDGTLEQFFDRYLADTIQKTEGSLEEYKKHAIDQIVSALKGTRYTKETLPKEPVSILNMLAFWVSRKTSLKHLNIGTLPLEITNILSELEALVTKMNNNDIIHRDLKLDNVVYRKQKNGNFQLALIDFGQSLDIKDPAHQHDVSTFWSANKLVDTIPNIFADEVIECYDKITLEMELLIKYGIDHKFNTKKDCRAIVNDEYITKYFRALLKANNYNIKRFESTSKKQKRKKAPKKVIESEQGYSPELAKEAGDRYYRLTPDDDIIKYEIETRD